MYNKKWRARPNKNNRRFRIQEWGLQGMWTYQIAPVYDASALRVNNYDSIWC